MSLPKLATKSSAEIVVAGRNVDGKSMADAIKTGYVWRGRKVLKFNASLTNTNSLNNIHCINLAIPITLKGVGFHTFQPSYNWQTWDSWWTHNLTSGRWLGGRWKRGRRYLPGRRVLHRFRLHNSWSLWIECVVGGVNKTVEEGANKPVEGGINKSIWGINNLVGGRS